MLERAIRTLTRVMEAKDGSTVGHSQRVQRSALRLAKKLNLSSFETESLRLAAAFHDVGKIGVPDNVLQKPGRLTDEEFDQVASHVWLGANILLAAGFPAPVADAG